MKRLVINLDRSPDRLARVTAEFARIGVPFERVQAIDARDRPDLDQLPQNVGYRNRLPLTDGEIACLLSHRACWAAIAQGDARYGAIFEDDIVFAAKAGALLRDSNWIPADAEVVKLESYFCKTVIRRKRIDIGHGFSTSKLDAGHIGTAGYIISRQTALDLIKATEEIGIAVDDLVFNPEFSVLRGETIYQLVPALCAQDQFLGDRALQLPSLLREKRDIQCAAGTGKRRKTAIAKVKAEARRIGKRIVDFCRLKRRMVIPFTYPSQSSTGS
ncbi:MULTISPECIES: glycosyltransferase family 25 protein [unclassified Mesorhizobium]|uniref:glycosyltransferase family 25 protein n=1 Tax=unclassified Mesorhizobium TaxID=325217 RepID=UPI000FD3A7AB|nr:glycosyltransferase family 25 protein [Mesorhizobium sp. M7A.F.Ca.US.010.02.1.1]RUW94086.1 glycosyl transferase [Mesorhizobium sp. M7A.F.Ca.US.010.02.1.1]